MDAPEGAPVDCGRAPVKRNRSQRQRLLLLLPPAPAVASPSTSSTELSGSVVTEEEEEMANCLILLARGGVPEPSPKPEKFVSRRFTEAATMADGKAGFYVYECKDCNKCFPSFQALGGHRTGHKRPKLLPVTMEGGRRESAVYEDDVGLLINFSKPPKPRVHECSICGAEFSSGQALGGHMRRHRPVSIPEVAEPRKEKELLSLDLNLPPVPSEEDRRELAKMPSSPALQRPRPLKFFPPAMVDCHY